jgi:hypothetical protein
MSTPSHVLHSVTNTALDMALCAAFNAAIQKQALLGLWGITSRSDYN